MSMYSASSEPSVLGLEGRRSAARSNVRRSALLPSTGALEWAVLLIIALLLVVGLVSTSGREAPVTSGSQSLKVHGGDTLWTLASQHPVKGMSTAEVVDMLAQSNGLAGYSLAPGQVITVPSDAPGSRLAAK